MSPRLGRGAALAVTLAVLVGGEAILWRAGRTLPALSPDPERMGRTLVEADPLALTISVLRLAALVVGAALIALTAVGLAGRALGAARLVAKVDQWTPPSLRHLLDGALGVGLAASIGLSTLPAGADGPTPTLRRLADAPSPPPDPTTTMRRLPDGATPAVGPATVLAPAPAAPTGPSVADPAPAATPPPAIGPLATSGPREVVVRPGDSFWRLAEHHEAERLGRQPTEDEVGACWQDVVASNRHRLVVPEDPDLIFPGQVMQLPCP